MADYSDFEELDLTGLNVDHVTPRRSILTADYGHGYKDTTRVGPVGGTRQFVLSAGVWPDDEDDCPDLIDDLPWMEYYTSFIDERLDNANEPFIIEWRNRKWLVDFDEPQYGIEVHTSNLFTPEGITLNLRRVSGLIHCLDGSVFDPSIMESYMWARYKDAQDFPTSFPGPIGPAWANSLDGTFSDPQAMVVGGTDVVSVADVLGSFDAVRFSGTTNDGVLTNGTASARFYDVWLVMKMREATFSNNAGIFSGSTAAPGGNVLLVGSSGTTKFFNIGFGSQYSYEKNNVSYAESDQQAPMNTFAVVHVRHTNGIELLSPQFGSDRDFAGRHAEVDMIEVIPCDTLVPDDWAEAMNRWLMNYYGIS
jgi:hypothetical protein